MELYRQEYGETYARRDKRLQGLGAKLVREAMRRWHVDLSKQAWTPQGLLLRKSFDRSATQGSELPPEIRGRVSKHS